MSLPHYRIKPTAYSSKAVIERWRESRRDMYDIAALNGDLGQSLFQTVAFRADNVVFSRSRGRNLLVSRSQRQLDGNVSGFVRIKHTKGSHFLSTRAGEYTNSGGSALTVVDYSQPNDMAIVDAEELGVYMPHSVLDLKPGQINALTSVSLNSASGRILSTAMETTYTRLFQTNFKDADPIAIDFVGLVRGLLAGGAMSHSEDLVQQARAKSMRDFLEQKLRDLDLGAGALLQAFGASRATIFRDFSPYGGVASYIVERRLARALIDLAEAPPKRGEVTRTAERWGFPSVSQFSRAFRNRFGFAPGSAVGTRCKPYLQSENSTDGDRGQLALGFQGDPSGLERWLSQFGNKSS